MCWRTAIALVGSSLWGGAAPALQGRPAAVQVPPFSEFDATAALEYSQGVMGQTVGDYAFVNRRGEPVRLSEFRGRPLVVSLIYTSCYHTCPALTRQLARVVDIAREALGGDSFTVLSIGFDAPTDSPERMRMFARERGVGQAHWFFLSADAPSIEALAKDLGFIYFRSPKGFDHLTQTTVLDAQGRVYRQVYGEMIDPPALVEPLKELVFGAGTDTHTVSGWIKGVRLFCTIYDPSTGRYRFDYSIFMALLAGTLSLGGIAVFLVRAWRESKPPDSVT
jgi:protein SCO1/2